jgi:hypothetical protein
MVCFLARISALFSKNSNGYHFIENSLVAKLSVRVLNYCLNDVMAITKLL